MENHCHVKSYGLKGMWNQVFNDWAIKLEFEKKKSIHSIISLSILKGIRNEWWMEMGELCFLFEFISHDGICIRQENLKCSIWNIDSLGVIVWEIRLIKHTFSIKATFDEETFLTFYTKYFSSLYFGSIHCAWWFFFTVSTAIYSSFDDF
jgi:hypothetical protein